MANQTRSCGECLEKLFRGAVAPSVVTDIKKEVKSRQTQNVICNF